MGVPKLIEAMNEAKRFLKKAEELYKKESQNKGFIWSSKESGALRRASMDLTRALAELRKY